MLSAAIGEWRDGVSNDRTGRPAGDRATEKAGLALLQVYLERVLTRSSLGMPTEWASRPPARNEEGSPGGGHRTEVLAPLFKAAAQSLVRTGDCMGAGDKVLPCQRSLRTSHTVPALESDTAPLSDSTMACIACLSGTRANCSVTSPPLSSRSQSRKPRTARLALGAFHVGPRPPTPRLPFAARAACLRCACCSPQPRRASVASCRVASTLQSVPAFSTTHAHSSGRKSSSCC